MQTIQADWMEGDMWTRGNTTESERKGKRLELHKIEVS